MSRTCGWMCGCWHHPAAVTAPMPGDEPGLWVKPVPRPAQREAGVVGRPVMLVAIDVPVPAGWWPGRWVLTHGCRGAPVDADPPADSPAAHPPQSSTSRGFGEVQTQLY